MSPPTYEQLPQEKHAPCTEEAESGGASSLNKGNAPVRAYATALACTVMLVVTVGLFGLCLSSHAITGRSLADLVQPAGSDTFDGDAEYFAFGEKLVPGNWKWWSKRAASEDDRYSTSTLRDGSTQTFVYTTRPIVNPGGYTIGTLTGYVPVSSTSQDAGPTTTAESTATPVSDSTSSSHYSTQSPSTVPAPSSSHKETSSLPSRTGSPSHSDSWSRVSTTSLPRPTSTVQASAPALASEEFDFSEVDYHLLHRRGLDFEESDSPSSGPEPEPEAAPSSTITSVPIPKTSATGGTGVEELSTSTDRQGSVYTLVKTTRPIVNPGGYTIGTLDGGWVDVAKIKPTPTATLKRSTHEELKKRETINF
ncbi:hypothetical protein JCM11491_004507 [Sporobolomyces phaffii]